MTKTVNQIKEFIDPFMKYMIDIFLVSEEYLDDEQMENILSNMRGRFIQLVLEEAVGEFKKEKE